MDAIFFVLRTGCQWGRWTPLASARIPRPTAAPIAVNHKRF
jgi:hypothetical protein